MYLINETITTTLEPKLFLGKFSTTLDLKNRFSVPAAYKTQLSGGAFMTQGFDRNLQVLTANAFQEIYRRVMSLNIADPLARLLLRLILGSATELGADKNNHLMIPDSLKDFANLHEDILLIGQGDYFEIWSPDLWTRQEVQLRDAETNSARFSLLTVATRS
jgi:MraZ protein